MTRNAPPFPRLAALLVVAVLACAVGPAAGAVAGALGDDGRSYCERMGHTMPSEPPGDEAPADTSTCCVSAPEAPRDAVVPAPPPDVAGAPASGFVAAATVSAAAPQAPPLDTGPPPGPRLHLSLSVFLV